METAREIRDGGTWCTVTNDEPRSLPFMGSEVHKSFNYYLILHTFRDGPTSPFSIFSAEISHGSPKLSSGEQIKKPSNIIWHNSMHSRLLSKAISLIYPCLFSIFLIVSFYGLYGSTPSYLCFFWACMIWINSLHSLADSSLFAANVSKHSKP